MKVFKQILIALLLCWYVPAVAQRITDPVLKNMVKTTVNTYQKKPFEKLYVQTDKPAYLIGDTIRLKAYLLNGDYQAPSAQSGILYVELDDEAGKSIKRIMLPVTVGLAWADIALDTGRVTQGNYTLRAYTNWMRNFGEDYIFKKSIKISKHRDNPVLVKSSFKQTGAQVETGLQFRMLDGKLMPFKDVEVNVMSGKKSLSKTKFTTGPDGKIKLNIAAPNGNEPLAIKAMVSGTELTIPVILARPENTDVQFMPEGGALVAGIKSKVGIKAIGEDGRGINISGKLFNSKGDEIGIVNTTYKGMGNITFTPQANETYTAKFTGIEKVYTLPKVNQTGTALSITAKTDSLTINIQESSGTNTTYYLIGQARGVVCYAEPVSLGGKPVIKSIAKNLFPTGITRFTLINAAQQPVNERIVFINHKDEFKFSIQPQKSNYNTRDMIYLSLLVTDKSGKPVQGSFSMAVTDNSQVNLDSLGSNILTSLLLTSDLKGEIEQPWYYFNGNKEADLDNLMLTQGWVGYDWKDLLASEAKPVTYKAEKEFIISGKVTNAFGKGVENSPIVLLSNKPQIAMDTLSDKDGRFEFKNIWPEDMGIFKLQARNKNNQENNVNIKIDEQAFPEFKPGPLTTPWYVNTDTTLLRNATAEVEKEKAKEEYKAEGTQLKEVTVKAKKIVKGSKNLNGPGGADLIVDEEDMLKAGKKPLEKLLFEKIKGLTVGPFTPFKRKYTEFLGMQEIDLEVINRDFPQLTAGQKSALIAELKQRKHLPWRVGFKLYTQEVHFIIDGVDLDRFFDDKDEVVSDRGTSVMLISNDYKRYRFIQSHLGHFTAEDITGIELLTTGPNTNKYNATFDMVNDRVGPSRVNEIAYIEITTRTKQGPFIEPTPGTYLYKPLAFTMPKQFYSPKYTFANKHTAVGTDMRSTIFWEPNIITDSTGRATVSFYSGDNPADYSIIIEGTDVSGGLGVGKKELKPSQAKRVTEPLLNGMIKATERYIDRKPLEKLYVHTDKPVYLQGDTIRLKGYLLNGDYRSASALSGILYVELDNEAGKNVKRLMLPVSDGLTWADMALDTSVKQGDYTLRAYTNWMRNFGEDYLFKKKITVSSHQGNPVLLSSLFKQTDNNVETALQFRLLDGRLMSFKDVELKLMSGKKNVSKNKFTTDPDGKIKLNFAMPDGNDPLSIKAMVAGGGELTIPVTMSRPQNTDVQFMPEGGALVAGITSKVGIKAIGEDGKGVNVTGKLYNSNGEEVAVISTTNKGMGCFFFTPKPDEVYTAKLSGINKSYQLPQIMASGTALSINTRPDSLIVQIQGTSGINTNYYLIGQARGLICFAEPVTLGSKPTIISVPQNLFSTGIARFTLINSAQQPVNERIVFINHKDELKLQIQTHKKAYTTRDSIALMVNVTNKAGKPVQGSFSISVTDKNQVSIDSLGNNILTNLLLTSDLKGEVEQPGYYFTGNKEADLDNLMLTQGWVGYDWKEILSPETKPLAYLAEKEFVVSGMVTNAFGKPMEKAPIVLMGNKPVVTVDALTDKDGRFEFKNIWPVDTAIFKLQARNKNSKEFNVSINMDKQIFPDFMPDEFIPTPWYVNTDTTLLNNAVRKRAEEKAQKEYRGEGLELRQVEIKAKKVVKGTKNLFPSREADLVLDEQDMLKAGKKTLYELLMEKIPGIVDYDYIDHKLVSWALYHEQLMFSIDGVNIKKYFTPGSVYNWWAYVKNYLDYYTAEEIRGIELKRSYIEITTRRGGGPLMMVVTPGTYLHKPLAFTMPKQFYSPKYTVNNKNVAIGTDMRSTIFWEPNMVTDATGKATVSFYSADKPANYSVIIEGTDMSGGLGFGKREIRLNR